jgi:hypothetical protein
MATPGADAKIDANGNVVGAWYRRQHVWALDPVSYSAAFEPHDLHHIELHPSIQIVMAARASLSSHPKQEPLVERDAACHFVSHL